MENKNSPTLGFNVERIAKVLFACNNQDDLIYLTDEDFKLLDKNGELTSKYDENIFIQLARKKSGDFNNDWVPFFPKELKDNLDFFMKIANSMTHFNEAFLSLASENILKNENFANAIILNCGSGHESVLKYFPKEICKNKDLVLSAVKKNGNNLKFASEELKKNREVVLTAIKTKSDLFNNEAMNYADESFLSDLEIARTAIACSSKSLKYFTDVIKKDKEIVRMAVNNDPYSLEFADKDLISNKDFILSLPSTIFGEDGSSFSCFSFLDDNLKKDRDIVIKAIAKDCKLYEDLPINLKEDSLIFTEALKDVSFASKNLLPKIIGNASTNITNDVETCKKIISRELSFLEFLPKNMQSNNEIISFWSKLETKNYSELNEDDLIIFLSHMTDKLKRELKKDSNIVGKILKKITSINGATSIVTYLGDLNSDLFQNLDSKLLAKNEVLNAAINAKPTGFSSTPSIMKYISMNIQEIYNNKEYIKKVLTEHPSIMEFFPNDLKNDMTLAEIAINNDTKAFKFLSEELKDNEQIINCLLLSVLKSNEAGSSPQLGIMEFASNRIKENIEFAKKMSNYGYVMKGFYNDKNIVMNALKQNSYAKFGDIWDFDIAQIAQISSYDLDNDNVKHIVNNKELMGMQFILAMNTNSRARDIVENTKPYFDRLDYNWIADNNIGVEDEYYY